MTVLEGNTPPLLHITLNTGHTTEHRDAELDPDLYALLQPVLRERGGVIPAMPGFAVAWAYGGDAVLIEIVCRAVHVAECGLAWGPQQAPSLWEFLSAAASPKRPVADAMLLGGFERCLGLALLRHRLQPN